MGGLAVLLEAIARLTAVILGGWLAYTEATGTYEYYIAEHGELNYIVKAAVGTALASVILPYFMHKKLKQRQHVLALGILVGFLLSVAVVFNAAVHRTGTIADKAEAERKQQKRQLKAAEANVKDIEGAASTDKKLVEGECKSGVGKECKRLAGESKGTLQQTIELRKKLADTKEPTEDGTARRLSLMTGGVVSEEQMKMFQPLLLPISVSFLAGLLITLGLDMEHPSAPRPERKPRRWPWSKREEEPKVEPQTPSKATEPALVPSQIVDAEIAEGDPGTFLSTSLKPGEAVKEDDVCLAYELWCAANGCTPIPREKFKIAFVMLCKHSGFRRSRGKVYGMQLVGQAKANPRMGKMLASRRDQRESV